MSKPVILCVDDEQIVLTSLKSQLVGHFGHEYTIETAEGGADALEIVEELIEDDITLPVVIADQIMPGLKGHELLAKIHDLSPNTRTILLTGQASIEAVGEAVNRANLFRYITKPWDIADLNLTVTEAVKSYFHGITIRSQQDELEALVQQLKEANESLESRVEARTREVTEQNKVLEEQKQEIEARQDQLEESFEQVRILSNMGRQITSSLSYGAILDTIYGNLGLMMEVDFFLLATLKDGEEMLEVRSRHMVGQKESSTQVPLSQPSYPLVYSFMEDKLLVLNYFEEDFEALTGNKPLLPDIVPERPKAAMYIPLQAKGRMIGGLGLHSKNTEGFSDQELNIVRNLAVYVGIALENANIMEQLNSQHDEIQTKAAALEEANEEITAINSNLERIVEDRTAQLKKTKEELDLFLYRSSHDLRRPLTTLMGLGNVADVILQDDGSKQLFGKVIETVKDMDRLLGQLLMVSEVHYEKGELARFDINPILEEVRAQTQPLVDRFHIAYSEEVSGQGIFMSNERLVRLILLNLVENAAVFCKRRTHHENYLTLKLSEADHEFTIWVENNGVPITAEQLPKVYDMFYIGHEQSEGSGLGLYIVNQAVEKLGGRIELSSGVDEPTIFKVILPVPEPGEVRSSE